MQYNYTNSTISLEQEPLATVTIVNWVNILAFLGIEAVSVPSLFANVLVFATIVSDKELRNEPTYMSMAVLAIADVSHCFTSIVPIAFSILYQRNVPSLVVNRILLNLIFPAWYLTCLSYCTIAVNRVMIICYPELNEKIFSRRNMIIWISSWPVLVLLMVTPLIMGQCCLDEFHPQTWHIISQRSDGELNVQFCVCYTMSGLTTLLSCICYPLAVSKISSVKKQMNISGKAAKKTPMRTADIRVLMQFILLTVVFTFAWITLHFEAQLVALRENVIFGYVGLIGYAAMTAINPIVYLSLNVTFRSAAATLLTRSRKRVVMGILSGASLRVMGGRSTNQVSVASKIGSLPSSH